MNFMEENKLEAPGSDHSRRKSDMEWNGTNFIPVDGVVTDSETNVDG